MILWSWMGPWMVWCWEGCRCLGFPHHPTMCWPMGRKSGISCTAATPRWVVCDSALLPLMSVLRRHIMMSFCRYSTRLCVCLWQSAWSGFSLSVSHHPTGFDSDQPGLAHDGGVYGPVGSLIHWTLLYMSLTVLYRYWKDQVHFDALTPGDFNHPQAQCAPDIRYISFSRLLLFLSRFLR